MTEYTVMQNNVRGCIWFPIGTWCGAWTWLWKCWCAPRVSGLGKLRRF